MQKKLKILNVITVIREGGMEKLINSIYKGLHATNEFDLYVCTMVDPGENFMVNEFKRIPSSVFVLGIMNHSLKLKDYLVIFKKVFTLAAYISKNKIDVVNSHDFLAAFLTRISVLLSRLFWIYKPKKNVVTLHNLFFWLKRRHFIINKILSYSTDRIVCVSNSVLESSIEHDKIERSKYVVIYNSIDENIYKPRPEMNRKYRELLGFNENDFIIGNVGTLSFRKGHKYLLEAFSEIHTKHPRAVLAIFGGLRSYEEETQNEIQKILEVGDLRSRVRFFDPRDDIKFIYNTFNLFVMSSVTEGLSLAAIEAMLTERICIFSGIGPFKELVENGKNGLIFESGNSLDLSNMLDEVITHFDKYAHLGVNARDSVLKSFSYKNMIESYYKLYKN